jgi:hypothetical protein
VTEHSRQPDADASAAGSSHTPPPKQPARARPAPEPFEQLSLDATTVGPGRRTADPYEPGTKLKIDGQRGVFVYRYATISKAGLVSLHLSQEGVSKMVRPDQVTMVKKRRFR